MMSMTQVTMVLADLPECLAQRLPDYTCAHLFAFRVRTRFHAEDFVLLSCLTRFMYFETVGL